MARSWRRDGAALQEPEHAAPEAELDVDRALEPGFGATHELGHGRDFVVAQRADGSRGSGTHVAFEDAVAIGRDPPETTASPPPSAHSIRISSAPVTGSRENATPARVAGTCCWTTTATSPSAP